MAYWWVSQGEMYKQQRQGHYLWAPKHNASRQSYFHWRNMANVRPGDVIISYADKAFPAVSIARSEPYDAVRPAGLEFAEGTQDGVKIDVNFRDVVPPVTLDGVREILAPYLPRRHAPLYPDGSDYPGYLFALSGRAGRVLLRSAAAL
jgi:hypothetical protein